MNRHWQNAKSHLNDTQITNNNENRWNSTCIDIYTLGRGNYPNELRSVFSTATVFGKF